MRIAYVVPYVPNLIRTRPYNLINQLAGLGNEVVVFTIGSGERDFEDAEALRSKVAQLYCKDQPVWYSIWNCIKALPTQRPLQTVYSWNPWLADQLINSIFDDQGSFDIVHVEHLRGSRYGQIIKSKFPHVPVVWDSVDCISYLFKQASTYNANMFRKFVARFELPRTQKMEGNLIDEFDHVFVTTKTDRDALLEQTSLPASGPVPISILSNGVDLEYFHPNPKRQRDLGTLVFSGKMSYHANISMVKYLVAEIMPKVWEKLPGIRLFIVGKDPTSDIRALGEHPQIIVTGTVDDIRPFLWDAAVAVVPLVYGAGIQNKILEAMACGTPVVTTSKAILSLQAVPDRDILVADSVDKFSQSVVNLLTNRELRSKIGTNGASYVKMHHSWTAIANQLIAHYLEVLRS